MKRKRFAKLCRAYATALYLSENNFFDRAWVTLAYRGTRTPYRITNYADTYKALRNALDPVLNRN